MRLSRAAGIVSAITYGFLGHLIPAHAAATIATVTTSAVSVCGGVTVDNASNVYFQDCKGSSPTAPTGTIKVISASGAVSSFGSTAYTGGLAISSDSSGNVYAIADKVVRLPSSGGAGTTIAAFTNLWGTDIAADSSGAVYVTVGPTGPGPSKVTKYIGTIGTDIITDLDGANAIALDPAGNIYVAESGSTNKVKRFGPNGGTAGSPLGSWSGFNQPAGIAIDGAGNIFVSDLGTNSVKKIDATGVVSTVVPSGLNFPTDLAIGPDGALYVYDSNSSSIKRITGLGITAPAAISTATSDCLFSWAERQYPNLFSPASAPSATLAPYYYRYYSQTGNYLATSSTNGQVYVLGPISGNAVLDVGAAASFLSLAGCH